MLPASLEEEANRHRLECGVRDFGLIPPDQARRVYFAEYMRDSIAEVRREVRFFDGA